MYFLLFQWRNLNQLGKAFHLNRHVLPFEWGPFKQPKSKSSPHMSLLWCQPNCISATMEGKNGLNAPKRSSLFNKLTNDENPTICHIPCIGSYCITAGHVPSICVKHQVFAKIILCSYKYFCHIKCYA